MNCPKCNYPYMRRVGWYHPVPSDEVFECSKCHAKYTAVDADNYILCAGHCYRLLKDDDRTLCDMCEERIEGQTVHYD
jgi:hypothetical protein